MSENIYLELADSEPTLAGHKEFAKKYGLLTNPERESISVWPGIVVNMRNLVAMVKDKLNWKRQGGQYVPYELSVKFALRFGPSNLGSSEMALSMVPANLYKRPRPSMRFKYCRRRAAPLMQVLRRHFRDRRND